MGLLNVLVGWGVYYACLLGLRWHYQAAVNASWLIGTTHSYLWNRYWTFRSRGAHRQEFPRFLIVNVAMLLVAKAMMKVLVDYLGISAALAPGFVLLVTPALTYLGCRYWSFRAAPAAAGP